MNQHCGILPPSRGYSYLLTIAITNSPSHPNHRHNSSDGSTIESRYYTPPTHFVPASIGQSGEGAYTQDPNIFV